MSDVLTVQTAFSDIADLAQGYIGRVSARQLVVSVGEPVESGQVVRFQVLLGDGTLAFWGDGHCAQVSDLGDEAEPHARYELLLHSLSFPDERSLPVFEYMVSLSESAGPIDEQTASEDAGFASIEPGTDEVVPEEVGTGELEALDMAEPASVPPVEAAPVAAAPVHEVAEVEAEIPRALSDRPGPPPGGVLTRMTTGNAWRPARPEKQPPAPRSGLFKYAFGELPLPTRPPRPEIDPAARVTGAPRPSA